MNKVSITVDGREIEAQAGANLLEVAIENDIDIPHLCYDPRLEPIGSCRLCFVEIAGRPAPVPACSVKISQGMEVVTNNKTISQLRKAALELLMTEHCGDCVAPCQRACPADIDIQGFIAHLRNGNPAAAAQLIREKMPLPSICGRVCPRFCEEKCRGHLQDTPVNICGLKRYSGDYWLEKLSGQKPPLAPPSGKRVAVVGGGPAGLTAAYFLTLAGHQITLYEAGSRLGGMLRYGIPEYRLPKALLDKEIKVIADLCHQVHFNQQLGRDYTLEKLREEYDAVFVAVGCQQATQLPLENLDLPGIYTGIGFLRQVVAGNSPALGERVAVVGGGNTAMDAARTAVRLGAKEVMVLYRRSREQMPAEPVEIEEAMEEGVKFHFLTNPAGFSGKERVEAVRCVRMELGEPDSSGRRRPVEVPDSEFELPVENVIMAIGQKVDQELANSLGLAKTKWGTFEACSETMATSLPGVYAAGDCVSGAATVVEAVGAARKAAISMDCYLRGVEPPRQEPFVISRGELEDLDPAEFFQEGRAQRVEPAPLPAKQRKSNFVEYARCMTEEECKREASRCLECGCLDADSCKLRELAGEYQVDPALFGRCEKRYHVNATHPYIRHDPDKCILCGKCVELCRTVVGASALGFVNRGYDTVVKPALDRPLEDVCISCGQCVYACPTGALSVELPWVNKGPWRTEKVVDTTCVQCDTGCALQLHVGGGTLLQATSPLRHPVSEGGLCEKGSFNYQHVFSPQRLTVPKLKTAGKWRQVTWDEALDEAVERLKAIRDQHPGKVAVLVSPDLTTEEQYLAQKLARVGLKTKEIASTLPVPANLPPTGVSLADVEGSDLVVVFNTDLVRDYLVVAQRVRKYLRQGGRLAVVSKEETLLGYDAEITVPLKADRELFNYLLHGEGEFPEAARLREELDSASHSLFIVDGQSFSAEEHQALQELARARGGRILVLHQGGNVRGQLAAGVNPRLLPGAKPAGSEAGSGQPADLRAAVLVGDSDLPPALHGDKIYTVAITARQLEEADVLLPAALAVESTGSAINCEGRVQQLAAAFAPPGGKDNREIIAQLLAKLGVKQDIARQALAAEIRKAAGLDI